MPEDLDDLAEALADGEDIDWRAARARQTSPDSRSVVEGLESISRLSSLTPGRARPSRRLPLLLEVLRVERPIGRVANAVVGVDEIRHEMAGKRAVADHGEDDVVSLVSDRVVDVCDFRESVLSDRQACAAEAGDATVRHVDDGR